MLSRRFKSRVGCQIQRAFSFVLLLLCNGCSLETTASFPRRMFQLTLFFFIAKLKHTAKYRSSIVINIVSKCKIRRGNKSGNVLLSYKRLMKERSLSIWAVEVMINGKYHLGQGFEMATFIHFSLPPLVLLGTIPYQGLRRKSSEPLWYYGDS